MAEHRFEGLRIVAFGTLGTILYGILHDQITAHLCVEYFTVAHPPIFPTKSPFWLAIGWGVIATWWVGLPLSLCLALAARWGSVPKLTLDDLRRPMLLLMCVSAFIALASGVLGATLVGTGLADVPGGWKYVIPPSKQVPFSADAWAHVASYAAGAVGGVFLIVRTARTRLASPSMQAP